MTLMNTADEMTFNLIKINHELPKLISFVWVVRLPNMLRIHMEMNFGSNYQI